MSLGSVVIVLLAIALLATVVVLVRARNPNPWTPIVAAMVTSGICFTGKRPPSRWPILLSLGGIVIGAVGLLLNQLAG